MESIATAGQQRGSITPSTSRPNEEGTIVERKTCCARCPDCFKTPRLYLLLALLGLIVLYISYFM